MLKNNYIISIVVDENSWINQYLMSFMDGLKDIGYQVYLYYSHQDIVYHDIVFYLSYSRVVPLIELTKNKHNLVIHESLLPKGKGWSPLTWQILEGKNKIPITLFEAQEQLDSGNIYLVDQMDFTGYELIDELRAIQAQYTFDLAYQFILNYDSVVLGISKQEGKETFYPRRKPKDSQLDINKPLKDSFNLLRVVDNDKYPAYFEIDGNRYELKIYKCK